MQLEGTHPSDPCEGALTQHPIPAIQTSSRSHRQVAQELGGAERCCYHEPGRNDAAFVIYIRLDPYLRHRPEEEYLLRKYQDYVRAQQQVSQKRLAALHSLQCASILPYHADYRKIPYISANDRRSLVYACAGSCKNAYCVSCCQQRAHALRVAQGTQPVLGTNFASRISGNDVAVFLLSYVESNFRR